MRPTILLTAFATVALAGVLPAQRGGTGTLAPRSVQMTRGAVRAAALAHSLDEALMQGITLSPSQRGKLAAIHEAERAAFEARRDDDRQAAEALRAARAARDTGAMRARMNDQLARLEARRWEHLAAVRGVLTPAQRSTFDVNATALFRG